MSGLDEIVRSSPLVREAFDTARAAHEGRTRKGSEAPQFSHPEGVAEILLLHGFGEEVLAAALLHDVIEDTDLRIDDLVARFPEGVVGLVETLTEPEVDGPRSESWEARKRGKLAALEAASTDALALCAADRLHNLRSLLPDARRLGREAWGPFTRGPEETLWFEREVARILCRRLRHPLVDDVRAAVDELAQVVEGYPKG